MSLHARVETTFILGRLFLFLVPIRKTCMLRAVYRTYVIALNTGIRKYNYDTFLFSPFTFSQEVHFAVKMYFVSIYMLSVFFVFKYFIKLYLQ